MNGKTTSRMLIWGGVLFLLFGVFMDTSVDTSFGDVINVSLVARQQMFLILGGIGLIGGIVLHGFGRLKQTPHDEARDAEAQQHANEVIEKELSAARERGERARVSIQKVFNRLFDKNWSMRLTAGVAAGLWIGAVLGEFFESWNVAYIALAIAALYALTATDWQRARARVFVAALVVAILAAIIPLTLFIKLVIESENLFERLPFLLSVLFAMHALWMYLIGGVCWFIAWRWARREAMYVSASETVD